MGQTSAPLHGARAAIRQLQVALPARDHVADRSPSTAVYLARALGSAGRPPRTGRPRTWPVEGEPEPGGSRACAVAPRVGRLPARTDEGEATPAEPGPLGPQRWQEE